MKHLGLVVFVISIVVSAQARLLETKNQLIDRYGEPISTNMAGDRSALTFKKDDLTISVHFGAPGEIYNQKSVEGLSVREIVYIKGGIFSDEAIKNILAVNDIVVAVKPLTDVPDPTTPPSIKPIKPLKPITGPTGSGTRSWKGTRSTEDSVSGDLSSPEFKSPGEKNGQSVRLQDWNRGAEYSRDRVEVYLDGIKLRPKTVTGY